MRARYIPAVIMLTAGAVTCIISIVSSFDLLYSLKLLLAVLIIFYIVGLIAKAILLKYTANTNTEDTEEMEEDAQVQEESSEEEEAEEE